VTLAWVVRHPCWGAIGLPVTALLLVEWLASWLRFTGKVLWIVADGASAKRPLLRRALAAGVVVVSRLRKDAALRSLPALPRRGQPKKRGRKRKYGKATISLAKRAAHQKGWQTDDFVLYGQTVAKTYKTFLAT